MRMFLILVFILGMRSQAFAGWYYIVNSDKEVIGKADNPVNEDDLNSRGEFAVYSEADIQVGEADYRNKKIIRHVQTEKEIAESVQKKKAEAEEKLIAKEIRKQAIEALKARGEKLDNIKE